MVREIYIYIEGIGDRDDEEAESLVIPRRRGFRSGIRSGKETTSGLRPGFRQFFKELYQLAQSKGIQIRLNLCGSRGDAYEDFLLSLETHPNAFNVLLVDSEAPLSDTPWKHLKNRQEDQWDSRGLDDQHCHLMVQTMEAWFIADLEALQNYYGQGFRADKIQMRMSADNNVENISVYNLEKWLKQATKETSKGKYKKAIHAPEILKRLNVAKVRKAAPSCDRLFTTLTQIMEAATD